jgi:predicted ATP-grasp superfamily ATP-dependent carboligase
MYNRLDFAVSDGIFDLTVAVEDLRETVREIATSLERVVKLMEYQQALAYHNQQQQQ